MTNSVDETKARPVPPGTTTHQPEGKPAGADIKPQPMPATPSASGPTASAPQPQPAAYTAPPPHPAAPAPQPQTASAPASGTAATTAPPAPAAAPRPAGPGRFRRFVRSVFSHLLFAGMAVAGVLGYLYHDPILRDVSNTVCADKVLGQWMGKPGVSVAAKPAPASATPKTSPAPAAAPMPSPPPPAPTAAPAAAATTATASVPMAASVPAPAAAASPPPLPAPPAPAPRAEKSSADGVPAAVKPAAPTLAVTADKPAAAASAPAKVAATTPAPAPTAETETLEQGWAAARKAFSDGKPEAVPAYRDLAKRFPDNPDLTGELGNILFQQGKLDEAGDQFLETGRRLIGRNQQARAACLAEVLQKFAPEKAKELAARAGVACPVTATR